MLFAVGCTVGSGDIVTESRVIDSFDRVEISTAGNADINVTGSESLVIRADDNLLDRLTSEVRAGRLDLGSRRSFTTDNVITYTITAAELTGATVSGSGNIVVALGEGDDFEATISGSGEITVTQSQGRVGLSM